MSDPLKDAIDNLFGTFSLQYTFWMKGKDEFEIADAKRMWWHHLKPFTAEQIAMAERKTIDEFPGKPPELGEFKRLINNKRSEFALEGNRRLPPPDWDAPIQVAKRATISAYFRRETNQESKPNTLEFNVDAVVESVPKGKGEYTKLIVNFYQAWAVANG